MAESTGSASRVRVRPDVQSLPSSADEGTRVLEAYAAAVRAMRQLDAADGDAPPTNPLGWRFQAALHGIADANGRPLSGDVLWNKCRHNSWFFFPWHRIYLYRFERIVQHHLGDDTWALPYWDYTKPEDDDARVLPAPFRDARDDNPLFTTERNAPINDGEPVPEGTWDARRALAIPDFALPTFDPRPTFGGDVVEDVRPTATGSARGSLEGTPHGAVHGAVGGWMSTFATAALDPVFWLHHANVDRLWEVWRRLGHTNPDDRTWRRTSFSFYDTDGQRRSLSIESVLETEALGYTYESTEPPSGVVPRPRPERIAVGAGPEGRDAGVEVTEEEPMPSPELVGAAVDVPLAETTTVRIDLEHPRRALGLQARADEEERWYLRVENIVGQSPEASAYGVYLDVDDPAGGEPQRRVGTIAAFGIAEASRLDDDHDGTGITDVFDISDTVRDLASRGAWDAAAARVTITPIGVGSGPVSGGDVRAGRISIYRG